MENALKIIVILSTNLNFSLQREDQHCDLWIVDSPENLLIADELRAGTLAKSVTTFIDRGNAVTNIVMMLPTVLEHHPDCTHIIVRGLASEDHNQVIQDIPELLLITYQGDTLIFKHNA